MPEADFWGIWVTSGHPLLSRIRAAPPACRIEQSVTWATPWSTVQESATAVMALFAFVRMPLCQHGSRKAIEHWRGSRSSPLGQNPDSANLGGRVQKGGERCERQRTGAIGQHLQQAKTTAGSAVDSTECGRESIWGANALGVRSDDRWQRSRSRRFRRHHGGIDKHGGVAQGAEGRVGGNGEHRGLLDRSPRDLEAQGLEVLLVDTRQLAQRPRTGKKTDPSDCEWIQRLHSCGLLRGSFRPQEAICMLRTLVRDKATLVAESGDWVRRMQKSLDQMNVRVHRAVSDIDGVTGMAILRAIVEGERDARKLAQLRNPHCRKSEEEIAEQLSGHWRADHLFSLQQALKMYDAIAERIAAYEKEILRKLDEMEPEQRRGTTAPPLSNANKAKGLNVVDRSRCARRYIG